MNLTLEGKGQIGNFEWAQNISKNPFEESNCLTSYIASMSGQNAQKHMVFLLNNGSNEQISSDTRELECLTLPHPKGEHV